MLFFYFLLSSCFSLMIYFTVKTTFLFLFIRYYFQSFSLFLPNYLICILLYIIYSCLFLRLFLDKFHFLSGPRWRPAGPPVEQGYCRFARKRWWNEISTHSIFLIIYIPHQIYHIILLCYFLFSLFLTFSIFIFIISFLWVIFCYFFIYFSVDYFHY